MSRGGDEPTLTVISWRDIPAQVVARAGRMKAAEELPGRFQVAIDRAAMYAGLFETDDYLAEWRRVPRSCGADLKAEVSAEVERILGRFPTDRLNRIAANGGWDPDSG